MKNLQEEIKRSKELMGILETINLIQKTPNPNTVYNFLSQFPDITDLVDSIASITKTKEKMDVINQVLEYVKLNTDEDIYNKWEDEIKSLIIQS